MGASFRDEPSQSTSERSHSTPSLASVNPLNVMFSRASSPSDRQTGLRASLPFANLIAIKQIVPPIITDNTSSPYTDV